MGGHLKETIQCFQSSLTFTMELLCSRLLSTLKHFVCIIRTVWLSSVSRGVDLVKNPFLVLRWGRNERWAHWGSVPSPVLISLVSLNWEKRSIYWTVMWHWGKLSFRGACFRETILLVYHRYKKIPNLRSFLWSFLSGSYLVFNFCMIWPVVSVPWSLMSELTFALR